MRGPLPEQTRDLGKTDSDQVHTWPYLLRMELLVALGLIIFLLLLSISFDAPLEAPANPFQTPNPSKAPWYFLGLQEMLVYFDPWIAGVALPLLIVFGLCVLPYLDPNPEGQGFYCWRPRRLALSTFWLGMGLWCLLIVIGTFFRGPGWGWFWPGEPWDAARLESHPSQTLAELWGIQGPDSSLVFGALVLLVYYGLGLLAWIRLRRQPIGQALGAGRFAIWAFLSLSMLGLPLKMALHLGWGIKYIWVTPWFRI